MIDPRAERIALSAARAAAAVCSIPVPRIEWGYGRGEWQGKTRMGRPDVVTLDIGMPLSEVEVTAWHEVRHAYHDLAGRYLSDEDAAERDVDRFTHQHLGRVAGCPRWLAKIRPITLGATPP